MPRTVSVALSRCAAGTALLQVRVKNYTVIDDVLQVRVINYTVIDDVVHSY